MQLGCMHLNNLMAMVEIPLDLDNDGVWFELLMGQGSVLLRQNSLAAVSREVVHDRHDLLRRRREMRGPKNLTGCLAMNAAIAAVARAALQIQSFRPR